MDCRTRVMNDFDGFEMMQIGISGTANVTANDGLTGINETIPNPTNKYTIHLIICHAAVTLYFCDPESPPNNLCNSGIMNHVNVC